MEETFTYYAIYAEGLYWNNMTGYWDTRPRLWSRRADAKVSLKYQQTHNLNPVFQHAIVIPMEVKPL